MVQNKIKTGICSITFRKHSIAEVVELAAKARLEAIEWGGDVHVKPGVLDVAKEALARTRDAGMEVSSYGSYHKMFDAAGVLQDFLPVLETAMALETDTIRIWAGCKGSDVATDRDWQHIVEEARRIADQAAAHKIRVAFEFHAKTLTDSNEATIALLKEIDHENMYTYWQPMYWGPGMAERLSGLDSLLPRILNLHVFHWNYDQSCADFYGGIDRRPLAEGNSDWPQYLARAFSADLPHYALLEFVRDDSPEQFLKDAEVLKRWLIDKE